ncbi:MAG: glycosyltransferase [Thermoproteus sp.]
MLCLLSTSMFPLPPWRFTGYGGGELIAYYLAVELARRDKLKVFATPQSEIAGAEVLPIPPSYTTPKGERGVVKMYAGELSRCDVVIDTSSTAVAAEWWFLHRRPTVVVRNGYDLSRPYMGKYTLVVYTKAVAKYAEMKGIKAKACMPGVEAGAGPVPYKVSEPGKYVLYLGRPHPSKGVEHILKLARMRPNVRFVLAWHPTLPDHYFYHVKYKKEAKKLGNVSVLLMPGGERGEIVKRELLARARLFVQPTVYLEAFGMVMAEALVSGAPVLTTTAGSGPELVDDETGALVRNKLSLEEQADRWQEKADEAVDLEELVQAFDEALERKWDRRAVAERARSKFSTKKFADCLLSYEV